MFSYLLKRTLIASISLLLLLLAIYFFLKWRDDRLTRADYMLDKEVQLDFSYKGSHTNTKF